jgi:feruloyl esterase
LAATDVSAAVGAPTHIASATVVAEGKAPPYCSVAVVVEDYARLELRLPASWAQRLLFSGGMSLQAHPMLGEFVTASWQDLGNRGHEEVFATNYQNRVNYAYRAMHLQVLAAKAIITRYFGRGPRYSYYDACSEPAREGMMEVQRFPNDFDGVAAGCPPLDETVNHGVFWSWNVLTNTGADGRPIITADQLPILHQAVLAQCDAADGVTDGIISDPLSCHPDLTAAECKAGADPGACLTPAQVHVAQEIYRGAHDAEGGRLVPVGALPGSELAWNQVVVFSDTNQSRLKTELALRYLYNIPSLPESFRLADLKFDRSTFDRITSLHYLYDATDTGLTRFAKAGHKLILWQALGDATVMPAYAIVYYTALQKQLGAAAADRFMRLYLLPGVYHCGGGDGAVFDDLLTPLMVWVERGVAPAVLFASHFPRGQQVSSTPAASADLTRPIYPYPFTAKYTGRGSARDAVNFVRGPARPAPVGEWASWFGSSFYRPGALQWCTGTRTGLDCEKR